MLALDGHAVCDAFRAVVRGDIGLQDQALAAFGRADNNPRLVQSRHEEMSAFQAVGCAKFSGKVGVCMATSGRGAVHLLNGLYEHVPSSPPGTGRTVLTPPDEEISRATDVLNAGEKVAILVGQGARHAAEEVEQVAELTGAGVAKALLGLDVLSDELPCVTGAIGLLGTRPSYELMRDCDTLLMIGTNFPYTQFMPEFGQAPAVEIDNDAGRIGMRFPTEVNLVAARGSGR